MEIRIAIYDSRDSLIKTDDYRIDLINDILLQIFGKIDSKIRNDDDFLDTDFFNLLKEKAEKAHFSPRLFTLFIKDIEYRIIESSWNLELIKILYVWILLIIRDVIFFVIYIIILSFLIK